MPDMFERYETHYGKHKRKRVRLFSVQADNKTLSEDGTKQTCFWCDGEVVRGVCIGNGCNNPLGGN